MTTTEVPDAVEAPRDWRWLIGGASPEMLAVKWTAGLMGVTSGVVLQLIEDGVLPAVHVRRRTLVPKQAVLDLLQLQREGVA